MKMVGHCSNLSTLSSMSFELFALKHETASDRERQRQRILNQRFCDFIRVITPCFCFIEPKVLTLQPELLGWLAETRRNHIIFNDLSLPIQCQSKSASPSEELRSSVTIFLYFQLSTIHCCISNQICQSNVVE